LTKLIDVIRNFLSWIFPVFSKALNIRAHAREYRWPMHIGIVVLILVVLAVLNSKWVLDLRTYLPTAPVLIQQTWLPLLFLLVYVLSWLGWWLWKLLTPEDELSPHPDIDTAWEEARRALQQAELALGNLPVFLVLGTVQGGEEIFFQSAASTSSQLAGSTYAPKSSDAPVRMFAGQNSVFITCSQACLLGEHSRRLNNPDGSDAAPQATLGVAPAPGSSDFSRTLGAADVAGLQDMVKRAAAGQLSAEEKAGFGVGVSKPASNPVARPRASLLQNATETTYHTGRLKHLCKLISRERWPNCPINGILILIPFAGTADDAVGNDTGLICQRDIDTVREAFQLRCPVMALVCDLEQTPGFPEFVKRIPAEQRKNRLGFGHPFLPAVDPGQLTEVLESEVEWIFHGVLVSWIYKLFDQNLQDRSIGDVYVANAALFRFLCNIQERKGPLARILTNFVRHPESNGEPFWYGGCYLAGTGSTSAEQAFAPGVLIKLVESQDYVCWAGGALAADAGAKRNAMFGYAGMAAAAVVVVLVAIFLGRK
jgi:hypothetical protein